MALRVRYHELGGPEVLRIDEFDPGDSGPGEVRVAVSAIGLNWADTLLRSGLYMFKPALPARIGGEGAGTIVSVGPGVSGWSVGDRVAMLVPSSYDRYGTYASETLHPANGLIRIPDGMPMEQAATCWIAFLTAWGGLVDRGGLAEGEHVLITAASSTVGLAALQIARDLGAIPIATTRGGAKAEALYEAGAAHVIATDVADVVEEIGKLTGGSGVRLIFDAIAGPFVEQLFACLAPEGSLVVYGGLSGQPTPFPRQPAMAGNLTMRGFALGRMLSDPERAARAIVALGPKLATGSFAMPIAHRIPFAEIVEAHRILERNAHIGKIVVTV